MNFALNDSTVVEPVKWRDEFSTSSWNDLTKVEDESERFGRSRARSLLLVTQLGTIQPRLKTVSERFDRSRARSLFVDLYS